MPEFGDTFWYISHKQKQPESVAEAPRHMPGENVTAIAHKYLDHADLFSHGRDSVLSKPLFYTDLKMPDQMSAHPHFMLDPHMLSSFGKVPLDESLVFGCTPPRDNDAKRKMLAGTLCHMPRYKRAR